MMLLGVRARALPLANPYSLIGRSSKASAYVRLATLCPGHRSRSSVRVTPVFKF